MARKCCSCQEEAPGSSAGLGYRCLVQKAIGLKELIQVAELVPHELKSELKPVALLLSVFSTLG